MEFTVPDLLGGLGLDGLTLLRALAAAFMAILFGQSGLDKVVDYAGNKAWLTGHFADSPLAGTVPILLPLITLLETAAGLFSAVGVVMLLWSGRPDWAFWGMLLSALSLVFLFFGQRMAKDYAGGATLVPYFILSLVGLGLLMG